jgi:hypothetical protein
MCNKTRAELHHAGFIYYNLRDARNHENQKPKTVWKIGRQSRAIYDYWVDGLRESRYCEQNVTLHKLDLFPRYGRRVGRNLLCWVCQKSPISVTG